MSETKVKKEASGDRKKPDGPQEGSNIPSTLLSRSRGHGAGKSRVSPSKPDSEDDSKKSRISRETRSSALRNRHKK